MTEVLVDRLNELIEQKRNRDKKSYENWLERLLLPAYGKIAELTDRISEKMEQVAQEGYRAGAYQIWLKSGSSERLKYGRFTLGGSEPTVYSEKDATEVLMWLRKSSATEELRLKCVQMGLGFDIILDRLRHLAKNDEIWVDRHTRYQSDDSYWIIYVLISITEQK